MPKFKLLVTFLNLPRLFLHILFFLINKDKCIGDVKVSLKLREYHCNIIIGFCFLLVFDKTFRNLFYFRIGNAKYLMWYWLWPHPCFTMARNMIVGKNMLCVHPFATIINAKKIGDNFTIKNNVTIGNNKRGDRPVIGNNVTIHANAVVIGNITLGNNIIVGASTVLTKSVPDNCIVVGNPAYILKENGIIVKRIL